MSRRRMMLATIQKAAPVSVFYRPSGLSGDSVGYWKTRNTNNYASVNEVSEESPDDSSYISCAIRTTSSPRISIALSGGPPPGTISGAVLRIRAMKTPNSDQTLRVWIAGQVVTLALTTGYVTHEITLTTPEAQGLNYGALDFDLQHRTATNGRTTNISWMEFVVF